VLRALVAALALATLIAAASYGLARGGAPGAMIVGGLVAYLLLPFMPARYAPGRSRS